VDDERGSGPDTMLIENRETRADNNATHIVGVHVVEEHRRVAVVAGAMAAEVRLLQKSNYPQMRNLRDTNRKVAKLVWEHLAIISARFDAASPDQPRLRIVFLISYWVSQLEVCYPQDWTSLTLLFSFETNPSPQ
jgi:hypothetical protein